MIQKHDLIVIQDLSKSFMEGEQPRIVLDRLNMTIDEGEFAVILGKSGSGKSTLLNLISGIDQPDDGDIFINGRSMVHLDDRRRTLFRRSEIGFIFQFFNLIPTLTVGENVTLPLELNSIPEKEARTKAGEMLERVGLTDRWMSFPDRLSGGEQQRVAIARALVHSPPIILADEPTGNLDGDTGKQVLELLENLTRNAGKNLIMVTHSLDAAINADRIFSLHDGKLFEEDRSIASQI
jgi:putative ABC transport system ATP-binding protein